MESRLSLSHIDALEERDLSLFKEAMAELLDRGSILGFESRSRELYQQASGLLFEPLKAGLALLEMELVNDDQRLLLQARPLDTCLLLRRFNQAETIFVLALWKIQDEHRQAGRLGAVILSLDDLFAKLKSYLPNGLREPPKPGTWRRILGRLQRRNLIRWSENVSAFGLSECQVLPTILYVIPFNSLEAWVEQVEKFSESAPSEPTKPGQEIEVPDDDESDEE